MSHLDEGIEFACAFETLPSEATVAELFERLLDHPDREFDGDYLSVACWDEDSDIDSFRGDPSEAAAAWHEREVSTITVQFGGFELDVGSDSATGLLSDVEHISIRTGIHGFTESEDANPADVEHRRRRFVRALESAAVLLDPDIAFGRRYGVTSEMVDAYPDPSMSTRPPLYDFNLFDAETVETIGHERVAAAPAWYVSMLDSGGAFLAVQPPPQTCSPPVEACAAVASHLGLSVADVP